MPVTNVQDGRYGWTKEWQELDFSYYSLNTSVGLQQSLIRKEMT